MLEPIIVETSVEASLDEAFDTFVAGISDWWPMDPFSLSQGILHLEPTLGGKIVEISKTGERFVWGHVTAMEKPYSIELAWYVGSTVETATQINVTFAPGDRGKTIVRLVQSGWEALGDQAAQIRTRNDGGWRHILGKCFFDYVTDKPKDTPHV
jgi:uncharacterized protein YndB with AHSA1/START domain